MAEDNPFARWTRVESIPADGLERTIEASPSERAALAARDGLPAIGRLAAEFTLRRVGRKMVRVRGEVHVEATQICVISLEPFDVALNEAVDVRFAAPDGEGARRGSPLTAAEEAVVFGMDDEDAPEPIVDGQIDLGALAVEFMLLGLDPYPRKPGVEFEPPAKPVERDTPFARLADGPKDN
jgi:uncharacterized metal-binding protein YceD (DUF177 family)